MVPLIINVLVGWVSVASGGILNDQRSELLDSGLDIGPVVILDLLNEVTRRVSQSLVGSEALVNVSANIDTEGGVEDTGLEVDGGRGGNSAVDAIDTIGAVNIIAGENELLKVADGLTGAVVIGGVPLSGGILDVSLDGGHVSAEDTNHVNLPVWVGAEVLDDALLVVPLVINVLVGWVVVANIGISLNLRGELFDGGHNS